MIKIVVKNRKTQAEQSYQLKKNVITVGRSRQSDVTLDSETVSRQHFQLHVGKDEIFIEDLGSGNGTFVGQKLLPPHQKIPLKPGDMIRIEDFDIRWESEKPLPDFKTDSPLDATDPDILEMKMIKKVIGAMNVSKKPRLLMISEPFQDQVLEISDPEKTYTIGREPDCDLAIDSPIMSRRHAQILSKWGTFVIRDLQSKNGVFVNGSPVTNEASLKDKDQVVFGTLQAVFQYPETFNFSEIETSLLEEKGRQSPTEESQSLSKKIPLEQPEAPTKTRTTREEPAQENLIATTPADKPAAPETAAPSEPATPPEKSAPKTARPLQIFQGFSTTEKALLAFGTLVVMIVIYALFRLLNS